MATQDLQAIQAQLQRDGFASIPQVLDCVMVNDLIARVQQIEVKNVVSERSGKAFGIRNLLKVAPVCRSLANSQSLNGLVSLGLGREFKVVRGVYLDKHRDANWKVAWHQDLTIAVRDRKDVAGYGPWSLKAGIHHVQPPASVLENMLAVRVHLDDADHANGALRVVPGSHLRGRLSAAAIHELTRDQMPVSCPMKRGDVMLMRPLLLHASSMAAVPRHRRVLHLEYASCELDGGIEWYEMADEP